ncbi:MAG: alpha-amlyase, partial [Gammaproteobacteria bacterium]|nr:alpha-amlyase [Gammaproteobacteria bacterium]
MSSLRRLRGACIALLGTMLLAACVIPADRHAPQSLVRITPPEWSRDAVIYQINLRQFTADGTLRAA